jgi:hypothetical protein
MRRNYSVVPSETSYLLLMEACGYYGKIDEVLMLFKGIK